MELVSFDTVKAILKLDGMSTDYPALEIIQESVVSAIESFISRQLEKKERTKTFRALNSNHLMISLDALPVDSVDSVVIDDVVSEYEITEYGLFLLTPPVRNSKIVVTYTGGYSEAEVPEIIKRASLLQTIYEYQGKDHIGAESVSTDGGTVNRPALGLLKEVQRLLIPFKHPLAWV